MLVDLQHFYVKMANSFILFFRFLVITSTFNFVPEFENIIYPLSIQDH